MSSGWRLARSLEALRAEIRSVAPKTTFWTIGDASHRASASDHNPNSAGVVCAADILGDGGLDLGALAERIRTSRHPALKYVIYQDRIASAGGPWRPYRGQYHTHVHVSVGVGPDGRSTGPYDDASPWGLAGLGGIHTMLCERGDRGPAVETLQWMLRAAGYDPGEVDGVYGDRTAAALLACRRACGSEVTSGDRYTPAAYEQVHRAHAKRHAAGKPGPRGPEGPQGPPGVVDEARLVDLLMGLLRRALTGRD